MGVQARQTTEQIVRNTFAAFPRAGMRITGRGRTMRQQAALMANVIRGVNGRAIFIRTYGRGRQYVRDMIDWYDAHRRATLQETVDQFVVYLNEGRARGERISNHIGNDAIDISWPIGNNRTLDQIENHLANQGARVIREPDSPNGRHWHVDQANN